MDSSSSTIKRRGNEALGLTSSWPPSIRLRRPDTLLSVPIRVSFAIILVAEAGSARCEEPFTAERNFRRVLAFSGRLKRIA